MIKARILDAPCLFCGAPHTLSWIEEVVFGEQKPYAVVCQSCGAIGPRAETQQAAIVRWETRAFYKVPGDSNSDPIGPKTGPQSHSSPQSPQSLSERKAP